MKMSVSRQRPNAISSYLCYLGIAAAALLSTHVVAAPESKLYCARPLRVALFEYGVLYRASTQDGADHQLVHLLQKRTGCAMKMVVLPRNRVWAEMKAGRLDIATAVIATPERLAYAHILPYLETRNVVLLRTAIADKAMDMASLEQSGFRMGLVRGFHHEPSYDRLIVRLREQGRIVEAADVQENLRFLLRGMVDAVVSQPIVYRVYLNDAQLRDDIVLRDWAPPQEASVGGLMLSRSSFTPDQAEHWSKLLNSLIKDGNLAKIFAKYLSPTEANHLVYAGPRPAE
jgi:polar amino acid transport system substrate-binding protein